MASKPCVAFCFFLESSSWLALQQPPDAFNNNFNIDEDWVADGSNVSDTECGARFTPVAGLYKKGSESG
jgi:hypothetical protein